MKTQPTPSQGYHRTSLSSVTRIMVFVAVIALIGIPLFSSSSASSSKQARTSRPSAANELHGAVVGLNLKRDIANRIGFLGASDRTILASRLASSFRTFLPLPMAQPPAETIEILAA